MNRMIPGKKYIVLFKIILLSGFLSISATAICQDGYTFAADRKGSVKSRTDISYSFKEKFPGESPLFLKERIEKIASILLSSESVKGALGVDIEAYGSLSEFTNVDLSFANLARSDGDPPGEYYHKGSSSAIVYINDTRSASGNILINEFFELPSKSGEFNGYPLYDCGIYQYVLVAPGISNPFLPCSREDLINALIKDEREKAKMFEKVDNSEIDHMNENQKQTKREYEEMMKMAESMKKSDPQTAAAILEAAKGLESVIKEAEKHSSRDLKEEALAEPRYLLHKKIIKSLEEELAAMSISERAKQAVWSQTAQEVTGKYSGLVPDNMRQHGTPLCKLNPAMERSSGRINFMVVTFLQSSPGMERTPADNHVEKIKKESPVWQQIFSLAGDNIIPD
ncbi:MAG: hypothetical protein PHU00_03600 [Bacteroidales bacterium]|nr:hypothetical protein [Bacteroidales bacterium]